MTDVAPLTTDYEACAALESRRADFHRARAKKRGPTWGRIADEVLAQHHDRRALAYLEFARDREYLNQMCALMGAGE
jgi:hypothetical protein